MLRAQLIVPNVVDDGVAEDAFEFFQVELTVIIPIARFHDALHVIFNFSWRNLTGELGFHKALDLLSCELAGATEIGRLERIGERQLVLGSEALVLEGDGSDTGTDAADALRTLTSV